VAARRRTHRAVGLEAVSPVAIVWPVTCPAAPLQGAVGRRPRTWFRLTAEGRQALEDHLAWLAQLKEAISASRWDVTQVTASSVNERTAPRTVPSSD
jgi:hypothetical protein